MPVASRRVRVDQLRRGDEFVCVSGHHWTYDRPDGALWGVYWCSREDGVCNCFAGCAVVTLLGR